MASYIYDSILEAYTPRYYMVYQMPLVQLHDYLVEQSTAEEKDPQFIEACALAAFSMLQFGAHRVSKDGTSIFLKQDKDGCDISADDVKLARLSNAIIAQAGQVLLQFQGE